MTLDTGSLRCNIHCMTISSMQSRAGTSHAALTALTALTALKALTALSALKALKALTALTAFTAFTALKGHLALICMSLLLSIGIEMLSLDI